MFILFNFFVSFFCYFFSCFSPLLLVPLALVKKPLHKQKNTFFCSALTLSLLLILILFLLRCLLPACCCFSHKHSQSLTHKLFRDFDPSLHLQHSFARTLKSTFEFNTQFIFLFFHLQTPWKQKHNIIAHFNYPEFSDTRRWSRLMLSSLSSVCLPSFSFIFNLKQKRKKSKTFCHQFYVDFFSIDFVLVLCLLI